MGGRAGSSWGTVGVPGSSWLQPGSSYTPRNWHLCVCGVPSGQVAPAVLGDLIHVKGWAQSDRWWPLVKKLASDSLELVRRERGSPSKMGVEKEVGGLGADTRGGWWD